MIALPISIITKELINFVVNGGNLTDLITQKGYPLFEIISFVSFVNNTLHILISGCCPNCSATHLCDLCSLYYIQDVISPIVKPRFSNVTQIVPVMSSDDDIENIVQNLGLSFEYPFLDDQKLPFHVQQSFIFHKHPQVDCTIKLFFIKNSNDEPYNHGSIVTRKQVSTLF